MQVENVLIQLTIVLVLGFFSKTIGTKLNFPYIVILMLGGTMLASLGILNVSNISGLPEAVRTLALIFIVYSAGFHMKYHSVKEFYKPILLLATLGVLLTTFLIFGITYAFLNISLLTAALLGVLWSGSDAAAISSEKGSSRILTILKSEAIFNSPLTVILPLFLLDYLAQAQNATTFFSTLGIISTNIANLFGMIIFGIIIGLIGYKIGAFLLKVSKNIHPQALGISIAIAIYAISEFIGGSGILAVAIASFLLSKERFPDKKITGVFNDEIAFLFKILVFIFLGAEFTFGDLAILTRAEIFIVIIALFAARLIATLVVLFNIKLPTSDKIKIGLISPKGIAPAALAPLILIPDYGIPDAKKVVAIIYVGIVLSILISLILLRTFKNQEEKEEKIIISSEELKKEG